MGVAPLLLSIELRDAAAARGGKRVVERDTAVAEGESIGLDDDYCQPQHGGRAGHGGRLDEAGLWWAEPGVSTRVGGSNGEMD